MAFAPTSSPSNPRPTNWLATLLAYGLTFALIAATIVFSVDETRALLG